jgi:PPP family 3-phenylpropionic acid transporter
VRGRILFSLTGNVFAVIIIQTLNGLTGPLFGVAGVGYAYQNSPKHLRATGQGLFNVAMKGLGTAVGGFISGILLVRIGGQAMYLVIGVSTLVILAIVVLLRSRFIRPAQVQL